MKKLLSAIAVSGLVATSLIGGGGGAQAGPGVSGLSSDNVEQIAFIPFEVGTATGANIRGNRMYITSWKNFSIYDVTDPLAPTLISSTPLGFMFENENVATNGKILLFSESLPRDLLHVYDLEDESNPVEIAALSGAGDHTTSCLFECAYGWGSEGTVTDLRDPTAPEEIGNWEAFGPGKSGHDITEIAPGRVFTATVPVQLFDASNPARPKLLATGDNERFAHSVHWPRGGKDKFALVGGETNANTFCDEGSATFDVMDTTGFEVTRKLKTVDKYVYTNGTYLDGKPAINGLGCSPHWFDTHPTWFDGGLVAVGSYEHGVRFLTIDSKTGKMTEQGWFLPLSETGTSAAYWMTPEVVYAVDYARGLDVLRYTGPLRSEGDELPAPRPGSGEPKPKPQPKPNPGPKPPTKPLPVTPLPRATLPATGVPALPAVTGLVLLTAVIAVRRSTRALR
ncbi:MAG TPA: hypothetical protein VNA14_02360 [Mycobacteriales bacterium]|nr:hypothetical protein [Mycobacteriales bacterium]